MPLPDGFLQELKFKTDINDVVSTYVTLKNAEIPMSVCVRFIMKKHRRLPFIRLHKAFIALVAVQAVTLLHLLKKLKILII